MTTQRDELTTHTDADDKWLRETLAAAPPFTDEQRTKLAELLRPIRIGGGDASP